jgi:cholest-4-en-3-one 26-monooxygenase
MSLQSPDRPASDLNDIDLLDLDRWSREGAPHDWFTGLRAEAPVWLHPSPHLDGRGFWVVSGHEEVVALGRCPHVLSSDDDNGGMMGLGRGDELQDTFDELDAEFALPVESNDAKHLLSIDPPEHTRYRKIVNKGFTPRMVARLEPNVTGLVGELLDAQPAGEVFDLVDAISMPLPMRVISDMLGAPRSDHEQIVHWSNRAITGTDPEYREGHGSELVAMLQMAQYFGGLRQEREVDPRDDLVTVLLQAEVEGESLSPLRFTMFLILLAIAGNETTRTAMSHAVVELARRPEEWARLKEDRSLVPSATEEILRWSSPVLYFRRNAMEDMEVSGQHIRAGDLVSLWYISANRDETVFDDPFRFDVGREPNHHVAFGGGGPHFCLGASLARLEVRVLLEQLLERYDRLEVVGEPDRLRSNFLHGIKHLPVRFS